MFIRLPCGSQTRVVDYFGRNKLPCRMAMSVAGFSPHKARSGFTLMELVIGILVIGVAIVMLSSMLFPQADRAVETLHRVRAAELANALMNEIWGKRYDENTDANGGVPACDSPSGLSCSTILGPETGEVHDSYDDVDDYNGLTESDLMLNSTQTYADVYINYQLLVTVDVGSEPDTKLVNIEVTTPAGEVITFNLVRSNY